MPEDKDRVQREIEDILRKIDDFPTEAARIRSQRKKPRRGPSLPHRLMSRLAARLTRPSLPHILIGGIALVILSFFFVMPFAPTIARYGVITGLALFLSAFVLSFRAPVGAPRGTEKRWRGRVIEPSTHHPAAPSWWVRLFNRQRRP